MPEKFRSGTDPIRDPLAPYVFIFHNPRRTFDNTSYMYSYADGVIGINNDSVCVNYYSVACGSFVISFIHEILHNHDMGVVRSPYCGINATCETLSAFKAASELDGVTFNSFGHVQIVNAESRWGQTWVDSKQPLNEMFAYLGSEYVANPDFVKTYYPNVYSFYKNSVYDGIEYKWVLDEKGENRIEKK